MNARVSIPEDVLDALGGPEAPPVTVAVSGGPDSVALALLLDDARREGRAPRLCLAHLNHRIRGAEADADEAFVRELAARLGADAAVEARDVPAEAARRKLSLEHAARECRYEFLERAAREAGARWVAVGHTADDQLETVLFNILRGAGIHGLAGMPRVRPLAEKGDRHLLPVGPEGASHKRCLSPFSLRIIRPLLDVPHADLVAFLGARGQAFRTDATNLDTAFTRNRIRHVVIPALEAGWPAIREDAVSFAREMGELDRLLETAAAEWLEANGPAPRIEALAALGEPLASYVVRALIARALGDLRRIDEVHVRMVLELLAAGSTGASLDLPRGLVVRRDYDALRLETRLAAPKAAPREDEALLRPPSFAEVALAVPGSAVWGEWTLRAEALDLVRLRAEMPGLPADAREAMRALINALKKSGSDRVQYLDADRVGGGQLTVRARRPGDRFTPLGAPGSATAKPAGAAGSAGSSLAKPGHTKLKDYLIRRKIPHGERDRLPLIEAAGRIVAVVTVGVSGDAALTEGTTRVLRISAEPILP